MPLGTRTSDGGDSILIHQIIATAGWGITPECVEVVQAVDNHAYIFGLDSLGEPAGVGFGLPFKESAWIGHLVVKPESRGQGVGHRLFEGILAKMRAMGKWPIYLTATEMGAPIYAKFGFVHDGTLTRWESPNTVGQDSLLHQAPTLAHSLQALEMADLEDIVEFDSLRFGDNRGPLIKLCHKMYPQKGVIARGEGGEVLGYLVGGTLGLGPFVAEPEVAAGLFTHFRHRFPREASSLTFLDSNTRAKELCQSLGMEPTRTWLRMRMGEGCRPRDDTIFNMSVAHG